MSDQTDDSQDMDAATPVNMEEHRGMLGGVIQQLEANGINVDDLAQRVGIPTADVDALSHDDLMSLAQYVATNHPEVLQQVAENFPAAQGLLGLLGAGGAQGGGGLLGGLLGRVLGGNP